MKKTREYRIDKDLKENFFLPLTFHHRSVSSRYFWNKNYLRDGISKFWYCIRTWSSLITVVDRWWRNIWKISNIWTASGDIWKLLQLSSCVRSQSLPLFLQAVHESSQNLALANLRKSIIVSDIVFDKGTISWIFFIKSSEVTSLYSLYASNNAEFILSSISDPE